MGAKNGNLMMMAALGACGSLSLSTPVIINEVTTAGSVYALSQFLSTSSSGRVGAPTTNAAGLADAFANAANLTSVASGSALSTTPGGAGTAPQENLNSIANALGACVQTSGATSANCKELFACAIPGAVFSAGACTGGTGSVADPLAAALSIARNPALVSVAGVYDVATKAPTVQPSAGIRAARLVDAAELCPDPVELQRAPRRGDRQLGPRLGGECLMANTVTALNSDGTLFGNFAPTGSNFEGPLDLAVDGSGHVWVTNEAAAPVASVLSPRLTTTGALT